MESMGYSRKDVEEALHENKYNDVMATYLLLSRKVTEVCQCYFLWRFCLVGKFWSSPVFFLTYCLGDAWEARDGSSFMILLQVAQPCAVHVASWIVMLSDTKSSFIFYLILMYL